MTLVSVLLEVPKDTNEVNLSVFLGKYNYYIDKNNPPEAMGKSIVYTIAGPIFDYEELEEAVSNRKGYSLYGGDLDQFN